MKNITDLADAIGRSFKAEAVRLNSESRGVKILLIVVGGGLAGVCQFLEPYGWFNPKAAGVVGVTLLTLGGLYAAVREKTNPVVLEEAREALEAARALKVEQIESVQADQNLRDKARRMAHLHTAQLFMREAVELCFSMAPPNDERAAAIVLAASDTSIRSAIDFQMDEQWTISIYKAEKRRRDGIELRCIAADRFDSRPASETRTWPLGVGHTGATFAKGEETVVPDLSALELGTLDKLPSRISHDTDNDRYRSIAAVPIRVGPELLQWGVVVATSDRPSRFTLHHDEKGSLSAEVVRALAGMVALAVASQRPATLL